MEKHTCKLCFRSFANGRALGGHMRSHVASTAKAAAAATAASAAAAAARVPWPSASSLSSSYSHDDEEEEEEEGIGIGYGLRENPRKSFRLVDPEFFPVDGGGSSVMVQDRESETESSRAPPPIHRRGSKRARPVPATPEPEPVSCVSDATPEEDVAVSLIMLSRDTWKKKKKKLQEEHEYSEYEEEEEEEEDEDDGRMVIKKMTRHHHQQQQQPTVSVSPVLKLKGRSKYQCGTCKKVFRSYQALGGHRANHKKFKTCLPPPQPVIRIHDEGDSSAPPEKVVHHQCPVCFRVFRSGQALGGHKRSHLTPSTVVPPPPPPLPVAPVASKFDLNLPAPMEDDAELSAVYDAETEPNKFRR